MRTLIFRSVADLPEPVDIKATEDDREEYLVIPAKDEVSEEDITRLKQELNHLPFDTVSEPAFASS